MSPPIQPLEEKFWRYVSPCPNTGCWWWDGAAASRRYGVTWLDGRILLATHASLRLHGSVRPSAGAFACHHCDQPLCVNPEHLYWGNSSTNTKDMWVRGRGVSDPPGAVERRAQTHCKRGHEFTPENVYLKPAGARVLRVCRICRGITKRASELRRKGSSIQ